MAEFGPEVNQSGGPISAERLERAEPLGMCPQHFTSTSKASIQKKKKKRTVETEKWEHGATQFGGVSFKMRQGL